MHKSILFSLFFAIVLLISRAESYAQTAYAWRQIGDIKVSKLLPRECTYFRLNLKSNITNSYIYTSALNERLGGRANTVDSQWLRFPINLGEIVVLSLNNALSYEAATAIRKADLTSLEIVAVVFDNAGPSMKVTYFSFDPKNSPGGLGFNGGSFPLKPEGIKLEGLCPVK